MRFSLLIFSSISFLMAGQQPPASSRSPADSRIAAARKEITANGKAFQYYNELASALCRKARDTADVSLYDEAQVALDRALQLSPGNYDAAKLHASVLLG